MKETWRRMYVKRVIFVVMLLVCVYVARTLGYLVFEYAFRLHSYTTHKCTNRIQVNIPDYIHQIYYPIRTPTPSLRHRIKIQTWKDLNPRFTHMVWNETAVINLIKSDHPKLLSVYYSYGHWVQRIDLAKYVILYRFGGWYADLDISCRKSLLGLAEDMNRINKSIVMHAEDTVGPATDFFGVTPRHPFIKFVLDALPSSNKWFLFQHLTIMFSTGPSFLWGRYLNYPCQDEILVLSLASFAKYAHLTHDCSWWGQDTHFIYYAMDHKFHMLALLVMILIITLLCCLTRYCIYNCMKRR